MAEIGLVLPTYNEAENLPGLVDRLQALPLPGDLWTVVVDDDSPDGTADVVRHLASRYPGISLLSRQGVRGLGSAIRDGLRSCLEEGCRYIVTMDADGSHDPTELTDLLHAATSQEADLVTGSRYISGGRVKDWEWRRRLQSRLANLMTRYLLGTPRESTTNYRVYGQSAARIVVERSTANHYEFQVESMLLAISQRLKVVEVPITFIGRTEGESKLGLSQVLKWGTFFLSELAPFHLRKGKYARQVLA